MLPHVSTWAIKPISSFPCTMESDRTIFMVMRNDSRTIRMLPRVGREERWKVRKHVPWAAQCPLLGSGSSDPWREDAAESTE